MDGLRVTRAPRYCDRPGPLRRSSLVGRSWQTDIPRQRGFIVRHAHPARDADRFHLERLGESNAHHPNARVVAV